MALDPLALLAQQFTNGHPTRCVDEMDADEIEFWRSLTIEHTTQLNEMTQVKHSKLIIMYHDRAPEEAVPTYIRRKIGITIALDPD